MTKLFLFEEDDNQVSEFDEAWLSNDHKKLQELADRFKEKPENELFAIMDNINVKKRSLDISFKESYSKYYIDTALSQSIECIHAAYMSNLVMSSMPDQAHHDYLVGMVPEGRRFTKWAKLTEDVKTKFILTLLSKYYQIDISDAHMYLDILTSTNKLDEVLKKVKGIVTDELIKSVTKNVKEQKELKKLL